MSKKFVWLWLIMATLLIQIVTITPADAGLFSISKSQEIEIGQRAAQQLEAQTGVWRDSAQNSRLQRIGFNIAQNTKQKDLPWSFKILNTSQVNAMALPGGFVYTTRGLMQSNISDQALAGVIGHEVAHVTQRHAIKIMEKALTYQTLLGLAFGRSSNDIQNASNFVLDLVIRKGYRSEEYDADKVGTMHAYRSGYSPNGLLTFLEFMQQQEQRRPSELEIWMSTHPPTARRIDRLEDYIPQVVASARR